MSFLVTSNKLYVLLLKRWFRTKGRSSRQEYILRFLMMWVMLFFNYCLIKFDDSLKHSKISLIIITICIITLCILTILSVIQVFFVTHRRLHDLNASGWWQLVTLIPSGQLLMIGFIFFKGTPSTNKYGEPPTY